MRSLVKRIWPFSVLHRIERKIDTMTTKAEQLKAVLDQLVGHYAGIKSGIESIQANLAAAQQSAKEDPMVSAALDEATDLNSKFAAMDEALAPHVDVPATAPPAPAPAPVADPAQGAAGGDPNANPNPT